jgi:hypothetical protein
LRTLFQWKIGVPGDTPLIFMDEMVDVMHQETMGHPFKEHELNVAVLITRTRGLRPHPEKEQTGESLRGPRP